MKSTLVHLTLLLLTVSAFGKTRVLKEYDFDQGGYYILGALSESDKSTLRDSIGEFYTDDIAVLNLFKKDWTFKKPGKKYACGYHYRVYVCRLGQTLESFSINLNCEEIVTDQGYFHFDPKLLRQFYGKLKKPYSQRHSFDSIQEARAYRNSILKDSTLIMAPKPEWTEYEGNFRFTYVCKANTRDCMNKMTKIVESIETEMKKKYPNKKFKLEWVGGSMTTIDIEVTCNKTLFDVFDLYKGVGEDGINKWTPFDLKLQTYWTVKKNQGK